jgi:5-methylthioadenosine/S-adenosylhomocysteine deaminase
MELYLPQYVLFENEFHKDYGILVDGEKIIEVAPKEALDEKYSSEVIDLVQWQDTVAIPGNINIHNHCFQSLLRGIAADRPFLEWRDESLYYYSPKMKLEDIYTGALFAFAEMMKRGVTTVCDFFYLHNFGTESDEVVIQAAKDIGIRLVLARTMYDWDGAPEGYVETIQLAVENTRNLANKYKEDDMTTIIPAPHSLHAATPAMIQAGHKLAKELGTCFHIHVAEEPFEVDEVKAQHGGLSTIEFLDTLGVVDESMVIVHGVWLKPEEIKLLGQRGGKLAYCPSSNMFLADGITDIPAMMAAGVTIGLGSDGACSNNRISVFEEMRMVSILQKAKTCDAMCINYKQTFDMGTKNGGQILQLPIGEIKKGYKADFVGIDLNDFSMMPLSENLEQMLPNIVYSMEPTAIKQVVVNGKQTVIDGYLVNKSEQEVASRVSMTMKNLQNRKGI